MMTQPQVLANLLRAIAGGTDAKSLKHDIIFLEAARWLDRYTQMTIREQPLSPVTDEYKDGDPLVTALIWEVDRAVKQAMREGGKYDTTIRWILNEHLRRPAQCAQREALQELYAFCCGLNDFRPDSRLGRKVKAALEECAKIAGKCSDCDGRGQFIVGGHQTLTCDRCDGTGRDFSLARPNGDGT